MPWIELHQSLPTHKKLLRLTGLLNLKTPAAMGHLTLLWLWALDNAPDGDVTALTARELAQVCQFPARRAGELLEALIAAGLLDREGETLRIHDWEDYTAKYRNLREKARVRQQRWREKHLNAAPESVSHALPTPRPDQTGTEQTGTDQTEPEQNLSSAGDADDAGAAGGWIDAFWKKRGEGPGGPIMTSPEVIAKTRSLAQELLPRLGGRQPTETDYIRVYEHTVGVGSGFVAVFDPDRADRLIYAFEQAALQDHTGDWAYINGILNRLDERGLYTLRECEQYDWKREREKYDEETDDRF